MSFSLFTITLSHRPRRHPSPPLASRIQPHRTVVERNRRKDHPTSCSTREDTIELIFATADHGNPQQGQARPRPSWQGFGFSRRL